jgi:hypothetical protein
MDDGTLAHPDVRMLQKVDGVVLRTSVLKAPTGDGQPVTVDPKKAQAWIMAFKHGVQGV